MVSSRMLILDTDSSHKRLGDMDVEVGEVHGEQQDLILDTGSSHKRPGDMDVEVDEVHGEQQDVYIGY